jgi:hypothetical protein
MITVKRPSLFPRELVSMRIHALFGHGDTVHTLTCFLRQELDSIGLRVVAEGTPDKVLHVTKIFEEEVFQRQGGCILRTLVGAHVHVHAKIKGMGSLHRV